MTYRDEHDALYEKNEALERRLEAAQKEIDRLRAERAAAEPPAEELAADAAPPAATADESAESEPTATRARNETRSGLVVGLMAAAVVTTSAAAMLASRAAMSSHYYAAYGGYGCARRPIHSGVYGAAYQTRGLYESHRFTGRVAAATGSANVAEGDTCSVTVSPVWSQRFNCRVQVECMGQTIYGLPREGFTRCAVDGESPVRARDYGSTASDGDPELEFDVASRKVIVAESGPDDASFVSITLDPAP